MGLVVLLVGSLGLDDASGPMRDGAIVRDQIVERPDHGRPVMDRRRDRRDANAERRRRRRRGPVPTRLPTGKLPRDDPGGAWWRYQRPDVPLGAARGPTARSAAGRAEHRPTRRRTGAPRHADLPARAVTQTPRAAAVGRPRRAAGARLAALHPSSRLRGLRRGRGARRVSRPSRRWRSGNAADNVVLVARARRARARWRWRSRSRSTSRTVIRRNRGSANYIVWGMIVKIVATFLRYQVFLGSDKRSDAIQYNKYGQDYVRASPNRSPIFARRTSSSTSQRTSTC